MKQIALILSLLVIFTSCQKAETEKDDANETVNNEQAIFLEIEDGKTKTITKVESEPVAEITPEQKPQIGIINDTRVRLRSESNLQSETLEYLNTGDTLTILDKSAEQQKIDSMNDYWYKVQWEEYPEGWVYGAFVDIEKDYEIVWVDSKFENTVRKKLDKPDGIIMQSDLDGITEFFIDYTDDITQIDDITHFKNLTNFNIYSMNGSDLSPLADLTNLTYLYLDKTISDISVLSGLTKLTKLILMSYNNEDLTPLSNLTNLTSLYLGRINRTIGTSIYGDKSLILELGNLGDISDISALSRLTNLTYLSLEHYSISDISPLSDLTNLTELYLDGNGISDIRALSNLTNLTLLSLQFNQITDITPLADLTKLTELNLDDNPINDVSTLASLINLKTLFLSETIDVIPLSGLTNLSVYSNKFQGENEL